jgi:hypothetical protein
VINGETPGREQVFLSHQCNWQIGCFYSTYFYGNWSFCDNGRLVHSSGFNASPVYKLFLEYFVNVYIHIVGGS